MTLPDNAANVRVGIFGPTDVVHRMIEVGHSLVVDDALSMSLSGSTYRRLAQLPARVRSVAEDLDVMLFAGPLPFDIAREAGVVSRPATFVELSGSSLYGAMLRALKGATIDLERVSIDSLSADAIGEAYDECGLSRTRVHSRPYDGPDSASGFAEFHARLYERGRTSGAMTTVDTVARELTAAKVPVVRIRATMSALRTSLRTAAFLGAGSVLEGAQVVIGVIELPELPKPSGPGSGSSWAAQELRLEIVRALRPETDRLAISLLPRNDRDLTVVATLASIVDATNDFTVAPFVDRIRRAIGITPRIGLGMGATAATAEANAELALADARGAGSGRVYVRLRDGSSMSMGAGPSDTSAEPERVDSKHAATLKSLRAGLAESDTQVVDAEAAARSLGMSARTARRVLQELAREGLAWPVPPPDTATAPGRPRQTYRLVES